MRDPHEVVIHDHRQMVRWKAIGFEQHLIINETVFKGDGTTQVIMDRGRAFFGHSKPNDTFFAALPAVHGCASIKAAAVAIVTRRGVGASGLAPFCQLLGCAKAWVGMALLHQTLGMLAVDGQALTLAVRSRVFGSGFVGAFVPLNAKPLQSL
jgi:hypothetical protein